MSALEVLTLDTTALNDQTTWFAESLQINPASKRLTRLANSDADADILAEVAKHDLRTVTLKLRYIAGADKDDALAAIAALSAQLQQAEEIDEGLPLTWTPANATFSGTLYVQSGEITDLPIMVDGDDAGWFLEQPIITIRLDCFPFIHGTEYLAGTVSSASTHVLTLTAADVPGDVPGLGRLLITETDSDTRRHVEIGADRYGYDTGSPSDLDIIYSDMTALAGSVSGSYITYDVTSAPVATAECTTCTHTGPHVLRAQVERTSATDNLYVRGAVRTVDGPWVYTPWQTVPQLVGKFDVRLGEVDFQTVVKGTQTSTIRFEAYSDSQTAVTCRLYRFTPIPTEVYYAVSRSLVSDAVPTSFPVFDQFNQSAGALAGKTAGIGGTWAGAGDADDFSVETTGKTAQRTAVSDTGTSGLGGRFATVGATTYTDVDVSADVKFSAATPGKYAVLARYSSTSEWINAGLIPSSGTFSIFIGDGGAGRILDSITSPYLTATSFYYRIRLTVDSRGRWAAWVGAASTPLPSSPTLSGQDSYLATGGAGATGKVGIYDGHATATACTRNYDNLTAYAPTEDYPLYSGQSAEFAHNYTIRENSAGTGWANAPHCRSRGLYVPPAGPADLTTRVAIKDRLYDVDGGDVDSVDSLRSADLYVTPRWLVVPG